MFDEPTAHEALPQSSHCAARLTAVGYTSCRWQRDQADTTDTFTRHLAVSCRWHPKHWDTYDAAEKAKRVAEFNAGEPGFGISACEYLASRKIILTGADNYGVEAVGPDFGGERAQPLECHIKLQTKRGIWNIENLDLSQLVADEAYEFLFVWAPLKIKGATGSPGNPVALY